MATSSRGATDILISSPNQGAISVDHIGAALYRRELPPLLDESIRDANAITYAVTESVSALDALWSSIPAFWVNPPRSVIMAPTKPEQSKLAGELGFRVPRTITSNDPAALRSFFEDCHGLVVAKQLGHTRGALSQIEGRLYTHQLRPEDMATIDSAQLCPTMFQELIPKALEIRAIVIGDDVFAVALQSQLSPETSVDWRRGPVSDIPHEPFPLPDDVSQRLLAVTRAFGLRYAAIDLILTPGGEIVFLELNPNGEFVWLEVLTGLPLTARLCDYLIAHGRR